MTAYGAVLSLKKTIHYILHSSHITLPDEPSRDLIQLAYNELQPLQQILEGLDNTSTGRSRKKVNELDGRIKDKIWEFEDLLDSHLTDQILSQIQSSPPSHLGGWLRRIFNMRDVFSFSIDQNLLQHEVLSFIQMLDHMETEYIYELANMEEDEDDNKSIVSSVIGAESKMIGLSDQCLEVRGGLMGRFGNRHVFTLVGMAGVGKTTLANQIYQDPQISRFFDCRAWVRVGRNPQLDELLQGIAAQLCGNAQGGDSWVDRLDGKRCLIVLDDVWEERIFLSLISSLQNINVDVWETREFDSFMSDSPFVNSGTTRILVTTRDSNVTLRAQRHGTHFRELVVRFLNEEESKELLCEKVFGGKELCPPLLDKAATKIARKCEGLPLTVVTVADILSKSQNRELEYWNDVAEERNSVFKDAYDEISKVLFPSYDYLLQYLKMPLLFMGLFPLDCKTPPSKIINMLAVEGWFLDTDKKEPLENVVWKCLDQLCLYKHLVLFNKRSIFWQDKFNHRSEKTCWLHSSWRYVCRGEARRDKLYHVLNRLIDAEEDGVKGQRGLCLENNLLFGIKEFSNSVRLNCASFARSLLFFGPYHQYPVSIDVGFRLLRELDALNLRFYTFPTEILTLVQLKYLALTCNGDLPTTISKLFNLQVLIVHPHINIRCRRSPSYVPIQIWDMQELEHIEILGKSLVAPCHVVSLKKLSTLVGVNASICTIFLLSNRIPNIRKLVVQIELTPYDDHNDLLSCFRCFSKLKSLGILKCSIMNPVIKKDGYVVPATPRSLMLPRGLKKLHLSGMGFPWEYMDAIGSLPYLQVLKLRSYAFRGPMWEPQEGSFGWLEFLLIEDSDLVQWKPSSGSFGMLTYLSMKHCYKLEEIHDWSSGVDRLIELVDCTSSALDCAKKLNPKGPQDPFLNVHASSSFREKPWSTKYRRYGNYM